MNRQSINVILIVVLTFALSYAVRAQEGASEQLAGAIDKLIDVFDSDWSSWKIPNAARDALIAIGPPAIPPLLGAMDHENPRVRKWSSATIEGVIARHHPGNAMIEVMKDDTYGENARRLAITLATSLNGADAVPAICEVYRTGDTRFREPALRALGIIGDASAIPILVEAAGDSDFSIRRTAISFLGQVGTSAEIPILMDAVRDENPEVRNAAGYAIYSMAGRLASGDEKDAGIELYRMIFDNVDDPRTAANVAGRLRELGVEVDLRTKFGFIDRWMVIGPFENEGDAGFDTVYPPEEEIDLTKTYESMGQETKWQEIKIDNIAADLTEIFDPNINVVAYATTSVTVPEEMDVQIKAGSDDALTIWLNGEKIHAHNVGRGVTPDEDVVDAHLKKGENTILLKICQGEGGWGYCLRIVGQDGSPIVVE